MMESTVKERLVEFIASLGITKNEFERNCGLSPRYVSIVKSFGADKLSLIANTYPVLNLDWLLNGRGEMLLKTEEGDLPIKPVLTNRAMKAPRFEQNGIVFSGRPIDLWHTVQDDSMLPECKRGDTIGLVAYPQGEEDPVPGALHAVSTTNNGILVRKLQAIKEGYLATALNKEEFPEMRIQKGNIKTIYKVAFIARTYA